MGLASGTVLAGKYRLIRVLGAGQMGEVWVALNELTDRQVAIKLVRAVLSGNDELRARVTREARACGRIEHRNVIEIYDVGQTPDGEPFLVMPLLNGETLAQHLERLGALPPREAAVIALGVARGLGAAHASGVIHRDLKPANVFLHREAGTEGEVVKLLDFGVSRVAAYADAAATATGMLLGSPAYMSPEQALGTRQIDVRCDLWAYGVMLFEIVVGSRPFDGATPFGVVDQVLRGPIPRLDAHRAGLPPVFAGLIERCLVRDVERRLARASDAAAELESYLSRPDEMVVSAERTSGEPVPTPPSRARASWRPREDNPGIAAMTTFVQRPAAGESAAPPHTTAAPTARTAVEQWSVTSTTPLVTLAPGATTGSPPAIPAGPHASGASESAPQALHRSRRVTIGAAAAVGTAFVIVIAVATTSGRETGAVDPEQVTASRSASTPRTSSSATTSATAAASLTAPLAFPAYSAESAAPSANSAPFVAASVARTVARPTSPPTRPPPSSPVVPSSQKQQGADLIPDNGG